MLVAAGAAAAALIAGALALASGVASLAGATRALERGEATAAIEQYGSARSRLGLADALLGPAATALGWLGPPGGALALAAGLADGGRPMAEGGREAARAAQAASEAGLTRAVATRLDRAASDLATAEERLSSTQAGALTPAPLAGARRRLLRASRPLAARAGAASVLAGVATSNRRYLLVIQNGAELRATGGLVGAFGILDARRGRLRLARLDTDRGLPAGRGEIDPPPGFSRRYDRFGTRRTWANANMSPDFPTSARVLLALYARRAGVRLDGVVAVDAVGLSFLLEAVGPVRAGGVTLTGARFLDQALVDAYNQPLERRGALLLAGARAGWRALASARRLVPVGRALGASAAEGHLLVYARDRRLERRAVEAGLSGRVVRPRGDYLLVVRQNAGANKLDYYLSTALAYDVVTGRDGKATATLRVALQNRAPAAVLPDYVLGRRLPGDPAGLARSWVSAYSPEGTTLLSFAGPDGRTAESGRELAHAVHSWFQAVAPGRRSTARARLSLPDVVDRDGRYRLLVQRQPALRPAALRVRVDGRLLYEGLLYRDVRVSADASRRD